MGFDIPQNKQTIPPLGATIVPKKGEVQQMQDTASNPVPWYGTLGVRLKLRVLLLHAGFLHSMHETRAHVERLRHHVATLSHNGDSVVTELWGSNLDQGGILFPKLFLLRGSSSWLCCGVSRNIFRSPHLRSRDSWIPIAPWTAR